MGERNEERVRRREKLRTTRREYVPVLLMPPRSRPHPHPPPALFLSSPMAKREAAGSAVRGRRGALCVSENVALIGGSVAVMRYQPPANKRINVKR